MPLARFALYRGGGELPVSVWPGSAAISRTVVEAIAREGRVWSLSVHGLLSMADGPDEFVLKQSLLDAGCDVIFDGGSSLVAPDGAFAVEPVIAAEGLITYEIDLGLGRRSRRVLDPTGHSFRPDKFEMQVNATRFDESSPWGQ